MNSIVKNYTLFRLTLTNANQEYSQVLNTLPTFVRLHCEDLTSQLRISFTANGSGTGEIVFPGAEWSTPGALHMAAKTLYIQSPAAGAIVDIIEFTRG